MVSMAMPSIAPRPDDREFAAFVGRVEERLRLGLVATYGPVDGRNAARDALSWAWEHWEQVQAMSNPIGYLYRVGQTATRRPVARPLPATLTATIARWPVEITPELAPALARLSVQQRTVVVLVHAFGWTLRDVAALLEINASTVKVHLERATVRLRNDLEVNDVH